MKSLTRIPTDPLDSAILRYEREEAFKAQKLNGKLSQTIRVGSQVVVITRKSYDQILVETGVKSISIFRNISSVPWQNYLEVATEHSDGYVETGPRFNVDIGIKELKKLVVLALVNTETSVKALGKLWDNFEELNKKEAA